MTDSSDKSDAPVARSALETFISSFKEFSRSSTRTVTTRFSSERQDPEHNTEYQVVLVRMASCQRTREYVAKRTAEGKSKREVMRCLNATQPGRSTARSPPGRQRATATPGRHAPYSASSSAPQLAHSARCGRSPRSLGASWMQDFALGNARVFADGPATDCRGCSDGRP
jgi:hypothetical protein